MRNFKDLNITQLMILQDVMNFSIENDEKQISPNLLDDMLEDVQAEIKEKRNFKPFSKKTKAKLAGYREALKNRPYDKS